MLPEPELAEQVTCYHDAMLADSQEISVACWMGAYRSEKLGNHVIDFGKLLDSISRSHEEVP